MAVQKEAPKEKNVIIVTAKEEHSQLDRKMLKNYPNLNLKKVFVSGVDAYNFLVESPDTLVMCDTEIEDMDAGTFIKSLKENPKLKRTPVVMVTTQNERGAILDAVGAGCVGYILRPYSRDTFERHMNTAMQLVRYNEIEQNQLEFAKELLEEGFHDDAVEEFQELVEGQEEAQKYYDLGNKYLVQEKYGKAIVAFQKAIKINDLFAEAYQGLADAYRGKGESKQYEFYLKKAAKVHAEYDRMEKVKELFIEILKLDTKPANPFNDLGVKLRRQGDYERAIHYYKQAIELTPNDENIYFNMARAYYHMGDTDAALDQVSHALSMNSRFPEALKLYKIIKGQDWPGPSTDQAVIDQGGVIGEIRKTTKDVD